MAAPTEQPCRIPNCGGTAFFNRHCAAYVCDTCENHNGMDRCWCGWASSGRDGRRELEEMGETIDPEEY